MAQIRRNNPYTRQPPDPYANLDKECKGNTHRGGCEHLPKETIQLNTHLVPDPYETESEYFAKLATKEESKANILKQYSHYIDRLAVFHTDTMELLRHIDYHWVGTDNRFDTKAKIKDLLKQGKEIEF